MQLKRKVVLLLLAALALAAPAVAHVPQRELAPAIDLLHAPADDHEIAKSFRIVPRHLFDDVAHVHLPPAPISSLLDHRLATANEAGGRADLRIFTRSVSRNLTSGLRGSLRRAIVREINGLRPETRWAEGSGRNRWYDPGTGTWLSPDSLGYQDSSNLYSYCAGNPIGCSDPTGLAASVSQSGVILGARPDGTRYRIEPGTDPVEALRTLESDADIRTGAEQEDILRRAGMATPYSSAPRLGEYLIGSGQPNYRAYTHLPSNGKWVEAAFVGTTGLPPQTREQQIMSGVIQTGSTLVTAFVAPRAYAGTVSAEPVVPLRAGNVTAPIPISIADQWRLPNGNRLDATGPHDVYAVVDRVTRQVYHFGETGRGWQTRGREWQRQLTKEYGLKTEVVALRTGLPGKAAAKLLETRYIATYEKAFGQRPFYINEQGEVITIQKTRH